MLYIFQATVQEIVIRACDMLTIVVPPAMPAAMTVGTVYSQARLRKYGIFCISPPLINVCGKLKLMCFDKVSSSWHFTFLVRSVCTLWFDSCFYCFQTGTLTEGGLDFFGVAPRLEDNVFGDLILKPSYMLKQDNPLLVTMAACHTLNRVEGILQMYQMMHLITVITIRLRLVMNYLEII